MNSGFNCPNCGSPDLNSEPIFNDTGRTAFIEYWQYTCIDCNFTFLVKE